MGIDPARFWANLYIIFTNISLLQNLWRLTRPRRFLNASRFIDDEYNINDQGEFARSFSEIYPKELQLKFKHQGLQATFLDLYIQIVDGIFTVSYTHLTLPTKRIV